MLEFQEDFFQDEVREGFLVPELMKRTWAAELEILSVIIDTCKRHGLTYYAYGGTLLGAVRHHGFIPWDDDVDIWLKRTDYMRLLTYLKQELPEGYVLSSIYTKEGYGAPWSILTNGESVGQEPDPWRMEHFHRCPFVCGVDIFPLDYIPRDPEMGRTQLLLYSAVYDAALRYDELQASGELEEYLPRLEQLCQIKFSETEPVNIQLWKLADQIAMMYGDKDGNELTLLLNMAQGAEWHRLKKEWLEETLEMPFENISITVPLGYEEILTFLYGEDWKTPKPNVKAAHDYPFYKKQMEVLGIS